MPEPPAFVAVVFEDEMNVAPGNAPMHRLGQLRKYIRGAFIENRMDRVETQPIEMKFLKPVERVEHDEIAHRP